MKHFVDIELKASALLQKAGISGSVQAIEPLTWGGNNRTYRIATENNTFVVKQYFSHEGDSRDRLLSEYSFLTYAAKSALGMAPAALARDTDHGVALYEFINGTPFRSGDLTADHVDAAAQFFLKLNNPEYRFGAQLQPASEACFSVLEHLKLIDFRLKNLGEIEKRTQADCAGYDLIMRISAKWQTIKTSVEDVAQKKSLNLAKPLETDQRCISPSDFGFHNALIQPNGEVKFIDFEYAGWDDPAKMICDFFSQLAVPVGVDYFESFMKTCFDPFPRCEELKVRARLIRLVYQIKWCCIALNIFLPMHLARRRFANPDLVEEEVKWEQKKKAAELLDAINKSELSQ